MKSATLVLLLVVCACKPAGVFPGDVNAALNILEREGHVVDKTLGGGAVRYLGYAVTPSLGSTGGSVTLTHYWACERALDHDYQVFVHFLLDGAAGWVKNGDHAARPAVADWRPGMIVVDTQKVELASYLPGEHLELRLGLFAGDERLPIDDPTFDDGTRRLRAGRIAVAGTPPPRPTYEAHRLAQAPVIDGLLEDAGWKGLPGIEGLTKTRGDGPARVQTNIVAGWDDEALYVAFTTQDPDIRGTLTKHDEPIYREETVEMFIAPAGLGDYIELQSSPRSVTFDAAFTGGARRNMKTAYDADFKAVCVAKGTIDDPSDTDQGWSCEWRVGLASIPGAVLPIVAGTTTWKVNFFRVAKDAARLAGTGKDDRMVPDESAWSPPLMGDFHNLERFGTLAFSSPVGDVGQR